MFFGMECKTKMKKGKVPHSCRYSLGQRLRKKHFHVKCSFGRIDGKIYQLLCIVVEVKCQQIIKASRSSETHVPNPLSPLEKSPAVLQ